MRCAYCNEDKKLTREHVIPDGFIKRMNMKEQIIWLDKAPSRVIKSEIKIKDVCSTCNNGVLSDLDGYAVNTIVKYNGKINKETRKLFFKADYDKLSRWLLKICYNSARVNDSEKDVALYKKCVSYIMGEKQLNNTVSIYAMFMDLFCYKESEEVHYYHFNNSSECSIDFFRIAPFRLREIDTYYCALRVIMINSFAFLVIVYDEKMSQDEIAKIDECVTNSYPNSKQLGNNEKVNLKKDRKIWGDSLFTANILHDNFMMKRVQPNENEFYVIIISKKEILAMDYEQIQGLIVAKMQTKDDMLHYYQRFEIAVEGYNDDKRELYQVPEFQKYIIGLIEIYPAIIWYLNLELNFFRALVFSYINGNSIVDYSDDTRYIDVIQDKGAELMEKCFIGVNKLTNKCVLDNCYNEKISKLLTKHLYKILKIQ